MRMFGEYPSAFFSSPWGTTYVSVLVIILLVSLLFMAAVVWQFTLLRKRHRQFFSAMQASEGADPEHGPVALLWIYIIATVCITIVALVFLLFRPHLL